MSQDIHGDAILLIRKLSLQNAVKHNGKATPGAVVGGLLGDFPELKKDMKKTMGVVQEAIKEVNSKTLEEQKQELLEIDPSALDKKEHKVDLFGFLGIKEDESIKTAFPPGPEKHPHIGHAKALLLNYELARKYNGKFSLRFEDTNPELVREEFYGIMIKDFKWLGAEWDETVYASDHMDLYYEKAERLLTEGLAYACVCPPEKIKLSREKGIPCECRSKTGKANMDFWNNMKTMSPGEAIIRLKIDLKHKNSTMRDPTIFRIIERPHARHGSKYKVWPTYDLQNSVMDGFLGVTHRLRSKEFEMRNELQRYIQKALGYAETKIYEFARFNLSGVESSGRTIREKIRKGELVGWDDPSLATIAALRRRGFQPEAIKEFVVKTGITKSESTLTWDDLIVHNKRFLDENANRYFFVADPVKVVVKGAPEKSFELNLHPEHRKGGRKFFSKQEFFISRKDFASLEKGVYRFMECFNVEFDGKDFSYVDDSLDTYKKSGKGMLHYLPAGMDLGEISVMMPDKSVVKGFAEPLVTQLEEGSVVQFERFGFARLDDKESLSFWFTH